jgi:hypothetical protein
MAKLNEIIGAEEHKKSAINILLQDTAKSFSKPERYVGYTERFEPKAVDENGNSESVDVTDKEVEATVKTELLFLADQIGDIFNITLSKEETNASGNAKANLIIDGEDYGSYSAISFLALGKMLVRLREIYDKIPLRDTAKRWEQIQSNERSERWQSNTESKDKLKKMLRFQQFNDLTGKHDFKIEKWTDDVPIGKVHRTYFSGATDVHTKAMLLQRIDKIIVAVDNARIRANQCEAVQVKLMDRLFDYLHKDLFSAKS